MAYSGFLLKIGDYTIDAKRFIKADSYSAYANMQDIDDYTDANGYEHRNAVELKAIKVEFETPAMLTNAEFTELMNGIEVSLQMQQAGLAISQHTFRNMMTMLRSLAIWQISSQKCTEPMAGLYIMIQHGLRL